MNHQRFNSIYEGLSSVCQKVYGVIPIQETWTIQQIRAEADRRALGITRDHHVFGGCVHTLVKCGLVNESPPGKFRRAKVTAKPEPDKQPKEPEVSAQPVKQSQSTNLNTIDRLSVLALQLKSLAAEIESAAIEIEEQNAVNAEGRKKLEQLQALLKGVA